MKKINAFLIMVVLFAACKKNNDVNVTAPPASSCKLTEIITTGRGELTTADPSTFTTTEKMEYNDKNLQSGYSYQSSAKYTSGKTSNTLYTRDFQYDANGYLIKEIFQVNSMDKAGKTSSSNTIQNYEYNNGRLIKTSRSNTNSSNGTTTNETGTLSYEYTSDGKLSKETNTSLSSAGVSSTNFVLYEYTNGKLSKLSFTDGSGSLITPLIEVNSQGLVTKIVAPAFEFRYQYDAEGNNLRQENWRSGTKDITVYELDSKQNVTQMTIPQFKGHPNSSFHLGKRNSFYFTHNTLARKFLFADRTGIEKSTGYYTYTYQYNSRGLPAAGGRTYTDEYGKIAEQAAMSYTYSGCTP
jgi:hypothetical protein